MASLAKSVSAQIRQQASGKMIRVVVGGATTFDLRQKLRTRIDLLTTRRSNRCTIVVFGDYLAARKDVYRRGPAPTFVTRNPSPS